MYCRRGVTFCKKMKTHQPTGIVIIRCFKKWKGKPNIFWTALKGRNQTDAGYYYCPYVPKEFQN